MSSPALIPFEIALPQATLDDLAARLARTRFAPDLANDDWEYGFNGGYLRDLTDYWARDFDWRATERAMNAWSHYRLDWHGQPLHLVHPRGGHFAPYECPELFVGDVRDFFRGLRALTADRPRGLDTPNDHERAPRAW